MRRFLLLLGSLCWLLHMSASTEITIKSSYPAQNSIISSLSSLYFELDFSGVYEAENLTADEVGLCVYGSKRRKNIKLYEGDANSGTLLETIYTNHGGILGVNDETFNLSKTYSLEDGTLKDGQLYTILISANLFYAGTETSEYDTEFPETTITFYGGKSEIEETLNFSNSIPATGSELKKLDVLKLYFDSEIDVDTNLMASLYDNTTLIKSVPISVSSDDSKVATMDFCGIVLQAPNTYNVIVPKEAILLKNTEKTLQQAISLSFTGGTYELFGYKSVSPASGSVCSKIGKVTIVPDWPEGAAGFVNYSSQYYGDDGPWVFPVNLYQGEDSTGVLVGTYKTDLNNNFTALQVNVTKQLEANTKYVLVFPEGLIPAWKDQGTGTYPPMKAYHSAPLTLVYTGANTASKWSVKEKDQLEKLGLVSLMTGGEATVSEGAKMALYCGEDSISSADLKASGTFCYADFGDLSLEKGADYSLVIPDSAIVNMPKTIQKFRGIAKPAEYATLSYKAGNTTIVADSVLVGSKVAFNVTEADTLALDSLTLDGASVELTDSAYIIDSIAANADLAAAIRYIPTPAEYIDVTYKSAGTTLETKNILKGTQLTFNVAECDTLKLDSLVLNGINVTDSIKSGAFTTDSLTGNAVIEANMQYIPTPAPETKFYNVDYVVKSVVGSEERDITSSTTAVAEDSVFTFKAKAVDENWTVEVSAGEMSEDSIYSLVVTSDAAVVVTYKFFGDVSYVDESASGVFTLGNQDITISTTQGKIVVEGAKAGDTINLYGLNGAKLGQWIVKQDKQTIDVNSGVYLVVVKGDAGKAAAKVSVK